MTENQEHIRNAAEETLNAAEALENTELTDTQEAYLSVLRNQIQTILDRLAPEGS